MRVIARSNLVAFWRRHPKARPALERWLRVVELESWDSMDAVQNTIANAKVLNGERVRFEIAGGSYRLIVSIAFRPKIVFIKFLGTHRDYDDIDPFTVSDF